MSVIGLVAGGLSLGIGQFAFGPAKSVTGCVAVVAVFAEPAAIAGLLFDLRHRAALHPCRELETGLSVIGSDIIAAVAFGRLTALTPCRDGAAGTA